MARFHCRVRKGSDRDIVSESRPFSQVSCSSDGQAGHDLTTDLHVCPGRISWLQNIASHCVFDSWPYDSHSHTHTLEEAFAF
ncbi:unnamed protein product [Boreogadus saida]